MIGTTEIIVIAIVALILFGASALPKFAKSLGQAKKEFDKSLKDENENEKKDETKEDDKK